ncbi:multidrug effflux MFS transporter [Mangrovicella endophytica]|uniref:multidrug effflux MFS transporter n=1 Tax=Mangrovicella endophytica TaxID=2066697 RepID=UPI000C9EC14C|nr:multidrug effflux MFS transporter [Mangrovicella endophytica]
MTPIDSTAAEAAARKPTLATLMIVSALSPLAINIFVPSMASIALDLQADGSTIGLGLSLYLVATALIQLAAGPLSDRYGRRPVILYGMVLFLLGTILCLLATTAGAFLAGRTLQAASATGITLSRAIVRDLYGRQKAASMIGYVTMGLAVAPMIGPAIGGGLDVSFGWRSVFWLLAGLGALTIALILADLPETNRDRGQPVLAQLAHFEALVRSSGFWIYVGVAALNAAVFYAFIGGAAFVSVHDLGMSAADYGLWFTLCALGYMLGSLVTARLTERTGLRLMIVWGTLMCLLSSLVMLGLIMLTPLSAFSLFLPPFFIGVGNGMALPCATAGAISVRPDAAGAAAGLLGALQTGLGAVASAAAAAAAVGLQGPVNLTLLMVAAAFAAMLCALAVRRQGRAP